MKEIIETNQIEAEKSSFIIDLVKHNSGKTYIELSQSIHHNKTDNIHKVKINPFILSDIISILENYYAKIEINSLGSKKHLTAEDKDNITSQYLKGVSIKDLALLFNQTESLIEFVLRNNNIEIVSNELPKPRYWKKKKRRNR